MKHTARSQLNPETNEKTDFKVQVQQFRRGLSSKAFKLVDPMARFRVVGNEREGPSLSLCEPEAPTARRGKVVTLNACFR